jgi:hypothetical protein
MADILGVYTENEKKTSQADALQHLSVFNKVLALEAEEKEKKRIKEKKEADALKEEEDRNNYKNIAKVNITLNTNIAQLPKVIFRPNMFERTRTTSQQNVFITPISEIRFNDAKKENDLTNRYNEHFYNRQAYNTLIMNNKLFNAFRTLTPEDQTQNLMYNFKSMADILFKPSNVILLKQNDDSLNKKDIFGRDFSSFQVPFTIISYDIQTFDSDILDQVIKNINTGISITDQVFNFTINLYLYDGRGIPKEKLNGAKCKAAWNKVIENSGPFRTVFPTERIYTNFRPKTGNLDAQQQQQLQLQQQRQLQQQQQQQQALLQARNNQVIIGGRRRNTRRRKRILSSKKSRRQLRRRRRHYR